MSEETTSGAMMLNEQIIERLARQDEILLLILRAVILNNDVTRDTLVGLLCSLVPQQRVGEVLACIEERYRDRVAELNLDSGRLVNEIAPVALGEIPEVK